MTIGLSGVDLGCTSSLPLNIFITGEYTQLEDRVVRAVTAQRLSILDQDLQELYNTVTKAIGCFVIGLATVLHSLHHVPSLQYMLPNSDGYGEREGKTIILQDGVRKMVTFVMIPDSP